MSLLQLRQEFQTRHMRATAIELSNSENTGWTQRKDAAELLEITYPTCDVQRAIDAISLRTGNKPVVMLGQRGSGKSHIMALVHHAFGSPDAVESWAQSWGQRLGTEKLAALKLQRGFLPIAETLSNQEFPCLWDILFARHPKGQYYRGKFESSGNAVPAKSLLQDMFAEQRTALILDELQTWYDGLHDEPGPEGKKRLQWAFNFLQTLSELAEDRPDLFCLVVSVRDNTTDSFRQIRRKAPVVIDFKGETARDDRKRLVLHRLFQNRENVAPAEIDRIVRAYANERIRLLHQDKTAAEQSRLRDDVIACWPFTPELLELLEDHILMAAAAQDSRDFIRMLAEVFRVRGEQVPLITPADFSVDDDECGVTTLIDSFATSADQERLREKAIRNLQAIQEAGVDAPHAREVISSIWVRSLSATQDAGGTRNEVQLDITRANPIDDNAFTAELALIIENSFNVHEVGTAEKRFCFKLPDNAESKLKAWAKNDRAFEPQAATIPGLLPVRRDQEYLRQVLNYVLKTPDGTSEPPSQPVVLDPNWEKAPWANVPHVDQPAGWTEKGKPILLVVPVAPNDLNETLGPWLAEFVPQNRNMVRFLLPRTGLSSLYDDRNLLITARCALLASEWKQNDAQYERLHRKYELALKAELKGRFDHYALLSQWDYQDPVHCVFHEETLSASGADIPFAVEKHISENHFAPEDFESFIAEAAGRNETMRQVLALLREPPLPGQTAIPYLGEPEMESGEEEAEEDTDRKEYGLPRIVTLPDGRRIDTRKGTIPQQSHFTCGQCGQKQDFRESMESFGHGAPVASYTLQCYCPECASEGWIYGGRYFASLSASDVSRLSNAEKEWNDRRDADLAEFWPREEIPYSYMTHHANFALPKQGYTHWWKMFNSRQLLLLSELLRAISHCTIVDVRDQGLGAFQQYLRNQNAFCIYDVGYDKLAPFFSNPNYAPKARYIENTSFSTLGRGNLTSIIETVLEGLQWTRTPWEVAPPTYREETNESRCVLSDMVLPGAQLHCRSSSDLSFYSDGHFDLVITDPPFGDNIFYSDLSNFFYTWLQLLLQKDYPDLFKDSKTPNAQEALTPRLLSDEEANEYYRVRLTACWIESYRVLKDGGLLAFTFHHSEDSQWAIVLESLFDAGFLLEQTFPIASDEQKGEGGQFGAKGTEYDIIHVCRKRLVEPAAVSWAKMRQWVKAELARLKVLLAAYKASELSDADVRVILRGKALEFYSRHYGQVFTADDEPLSIRHALGGINQLLDEGTGDAAGNPPSIVQPVAYQYLRLFTATPSRTPNDVSKSLFGTTIRQRDFEDRGWVEERNRRVTAVPIPQRFEFSRKRPRKEMKTEIDQAHFLIGGAMPKSGVNLQDEFSRDTWMVRRSVDAVLEWYAKNAPEAAIRQASELARTILRQTLEKLRQEPVELDRQLKLFNDWDEAE